MAVNLNLQGDYAAGLVAAREAVAIAKDSGNASSVSIAQGDEAAALLGLEQAQDTHRVIESALAGMTGVDQPRVLRQLEVVQRNILVAMGVSATQLKLLGAQSCRAGRCDHVTVLIAKRGQVH